MFSLKTRPLIILYIRLKHPIYASKSGQLGYYTSCGNDKFELLQIRKHFYSFCIRRGAWRGGGWRGWRLKGSGKERKCSAIIQCGVNKTNTSLKTFPVHKRERGKQWNIIEQSLVGIYFNWNQGYVYLFMVC